MFLTTLRVYLWLVLIPCICEVMGSEFNLLGVHEKCGTLPSGRQPKEFADPCVRSMICSTTRSADNALCSQSYGANVAIAVKGSCKFDFMCLDIGYTLIFVHKSKSNAKLTIDHKESV